MSWVTRAPADGPGRSASASLDRGVTIARPVAVACAGLFTLTAVWAGTATWLFAFRDDFVGSLLRRQLEAQHAYEDRLAALRSQLDRLASRQLLEQDAFEARVGGLARRQAELESRQAIVNALAEQLQATTLRVAPSPARTSPPADAALTSVGQPARAKPAPLPDAPSPRDVLSAPVGAAMVPLRSGGHTGLVHPDASLPARVALTERSARDLDAAQMNALAQALAFARVRAAQLRSVVLDVGLDPDRLSTSAGGEARGGPLVPVALARSSEPFASLAGELTTTLDAVSRLSRSVASLPLGRPSSAALDVTSGFGVRLDPFTRSPALHTGIDFRADYGDAVRAAGQGRVIAAEHSGGYGQMVEIDHGHGITSRYAHLSAINVVPGQAVAAGAVLGHVGTSGRSTGPHLHYETRLSGDPVDPARFLRVGERFQRWPEPLAGRQSMSSTSPPPP